MSDDDLRFGDVDGSGDQSGGLRDDIDFVPLGVGVVVLVVLLVGQPLSSSYGGLSMNLIGSLFVAVFAILAAFGELDN